MTRILLLFLCLLLQKQPTSNKQGAQEQINKPTTNQPAPDIQEPIGSIESQPHNDGHQDDDRAQRVKEINDRLLVVFTGVLAVVGILQIILILRQEKWMRENVKVSQENADTAKVGADALKNIYRAWVLFRWKNRGQTVGNYIFSIKNWGQTPAIIESGFFAPQVLTEEELSALPIETEYKKRLPLPHVLAPNECLELPYGNTEADSGTDWNEVYQSTKHVVWRGVVRYRDVLKPDVLHETRFCYSYTNTKGKPQVGPSEHNSTT